MSLTATAAGLLVPDWRKRVFPMYPRRVLTPEEYHKLHKKIFNDIMKKHYAGLQESSGILL
jgi:hypothetical protein